MGWTKSLWGFCHVITVNKKYHFLNIIMIYCLINAFVYFGCYHTNRSKVDRCHRSVDVVIIDNRRSSIVETIIRLLIDRSIAAVDLIIRRCVLSSVAFKMYTQEHVLLARTTLLLLLRRRKCNARVTLSSIDRCTSQFNHRSTVW